MTIQISTLASILLVFTYITCIIPIHGTRNQARLSLIHFAPTSSKSIGFTDAEGSPVHNQDQVLSKTINLDNTTVASLYELLYKTLQLKYNEVVMIKNQDNTVFSDYMNKPVHKDLRTLTQAGFKGDEIQCYIKTDRWFKDMYIEEIEKEKNGLVRSGKIPIDEDMQTWSLGALLMQSRMAIYQKYGSGNRIFLTTFTDQNNNRLKDLRRYYSALELKPLYKMDHPITEIRFTIQEKSDIIQFELDDDTISPFKLTEDMIESFTVRDLIEEIRLLRLSNLTRNPDQKIDNYEVILGYRNLIEHNWLELTEAQSIGIWMKLIHEESHYYQTLRELGLNKHADFQCRLISVEEKNLGPFLKSSLNTVDPKGRKINLEKISFASFYISPNEYNSGPQFLIPNQLVPCKAIVCRLFDLDRRRIPNQNMQDKFYTQSIRVVQVKKHEVENLQKIIDIMHSIRGYDCDNLKLLLLNHEEKKKLFNTHDELNHIILNKGIDYMDKPRDELQGVKIFHLDQGGKLTLPSALRKVAYTIFGDSIGQMIADRKPRNAIWQVLEFTGYTPSLGCSYNTNIFLSNENYFVITYDLCKPKRATLVM